MEEFGTRHRLQHRLHMSVVGKWRRCDDCISTLSPSSKISASSFFLCSVFFVYSLPPYFVLSSFSVLRISFRSCPSIFILSFVLSFAISFLLLLSPFSFFVHFLAFSIVFFFPFFFLALPLSFLPAFSVSRRSL